MKPLTLLKSAVFFFLALLCCITIEVQTNAQTKKSEQVKAQKEKEKEKEKEKKKKKKTKNKGKGKEKRKGKEKGKKKDKGKGGKKTKTTAELEAAGSSRGAGVVFEKINPKATPEDLANKMPMRWMFHEGKIVFTPLGQLDAHAVASQQYKGLLLYSFGENSVLAKAGLQKWDVIEKIGDKSLAAMVSDKQTGIIPAQQFAAALLQHEAIGGNLTLTCRRHVFDEGKEPKEIVVEIPIKKLGEFSDFLKDGKLEGRAREHSQTALNTILSSQREDGSWACGYGSQISTSLAGVHLIMLSEAFPDRRQEILKCLKTSVDYLESRERWQWCWDHGAATWFLAEYFWATGDMAAYETLHRYLGMTEHAINPLGGVCHKSLAAPYRNINMGGPSALVRLALKASEQTRCSYNRETTSALMDFQMYTYVTKSRIERGNALTYYGTIGSQRTIAETGFTTSAFMVGIHRNDYGGDPRADMKTRHVSQMHALLQECHPQISNIHSTPSFGTIFASMAYSCFAKNSDDAFKNSLVHKRLWQLVLCLDSQGKFQYNYPRYARMAIPGGGGWGGDGIAGKAHQTALISISLFQAHQKNLCVNAGKANARPFCWLSENDAQKTLAAVDDFHRKRMSQMAEEVKSTLANKEYAKSLYHTDMLLSSYPEQFDSLYSTDVLSTLSATLKAAEKNKIKFDDHRRTDGVAFVTKIYGPEARNPNIRNVTNWTKRLDELLVASPKSISTMKARVQKLAKQ